MFPIALVIKIVVCLVILALVGILCKASYVKAPPDMAYIISGLHRNPRILVGKAGFKIPFFERLDQLSLGAIQIDVKTGSAVPTAEYINVRVDSTVSVRVGQSPEMIALAAQNFLNVDRTDIARKINDLLEGNIREIVGQMKLTEMIGDRKSFSEKVQENAVPDLARYGLELITFNVQNFTDDNDVITNLGIDNVAQISKNAAIARSNAEREVEVAKAENAKQANDAKVKSAEEIAKRDADLAVRKAELKRNVDTQKAQADAAMAIEAENQRKLKDVAATDANIAKAERETALKQKQIELKEYELDAVVRKQADAEKYAAEKKAEAIKDVAVIGLPDKRLGEIPGAIIQLKKGMTATEDEFNEFCMALARYKRPRRIIFDEVPRNATGKIQKPLLRKKYGAEKLVAQEINLDEEKIEK